MAWVETQALTCGEAEQLEDVEDDLQRELAFYNQVRLLTPPPLRKSLSLFALPALELLLSPVSLGI